MTNTKPVSAPSIDPEEIAYFENLAHRWWDAEGPFWPLHKLNAFRTGYIHQQLSREFGTDPTAEYPLKDLRLLDIGSGGGILSESMARLGARVTGIEVYGECSNRRCVEYPFHLSELLTRNQTR